MQRVYDALLRAAQSPLFTNETVIKRQLVGYYAILALSCMIYLALDTHPIVITVGALPGAIFFLAGGLAHSIRSDFEMQQGFLV